MMNARLALAAAIALAAAPIVANAAEPHLTESVFGRTPEGQVVKEITLKNNHNITLNLITYGARVQSLYTPDRNGKVSDVALGFRTLKPYLAPNTYFGSIVGRFANRIANGRFTLDGKTYQLTINNPPNSLHGGTVGFDARIWKIIATHNGENPSVTMEYVSPNGDQGYPGRVVAKAKYTLNERNQMVIVLTATTDAPTIVNLSNHTYWNLSGEGSGTVMNEQLMIPASKITPINDTEIPTGAIVSVKGTPFDFMHPMPIGSRILDGQSKQLLYGHGYDMNYVFGSSKSKDMRLMASVYDPASGRVLKLYSRQPGLQFYSGNFLNGTLVGVSGHTYRQGDAFVLEPQLFPDAPNHPNFPSAVLKPGQTYRNVIRYDFSVK